MKLSVPNAANAKVGNRFYVRSLKRTTAGGVGGEGQLDFSVDNNSGFIALLLEDI